jgi:hypothetical protein
MGSRIKLTRQDALKFLRAGVAKWPKETLIYLDPPYYVKGRDLYYDFYAPEDHREVADFINTSIRRQQWIVSYDNVKPIRDLYKGSRHVVYNIGYSARSASQGSEVMFFCDTLKVPPLIGPIQLTEDHAGVLRHWHSCSMVFPSAVSSRQLLGKPMGVSSYFGPFGLRRPSDQLASPHKVRSAL